VSKARTTRFGWYLRGVAGMSPAEVAWRTRDRALRLAWSRRQARPEQLASAVPLPAGERRFTAVLQPEGAGRVPEEARNAVLEAASGLLPGEREVRGVAGARQAWEVSRLQDLTLLATAWFLTQEQAYADRAAEQLRSWWQENPIPSGVNSTSGIELGVRLISLAWIRRLLADWSDVADLFERDALAVHQIRWHQQYLAALPRRGVAGSHVIAEAAGQLVASCAFPWFPESERWRRKSALLLERELVRNTFPSGIVRGLASDCQSFIAELGLIAAVEAEASGHSLSAGTWRRLCAMVDSAAALVDGQLRPALHADSGEDRALLLDAPVPNCWSSLLALGEVLLGRLDWWPRVTADARSSIFGTLAREKHDLEDRPSRRASRFADAGVALLRTAGEDSPEIWCRCDGGPHRQLSIAGSEALSVEIRYAGVDILADPGICRDHTEPPWRSNWVGHARAREIEIIDDGDIASWTAEHDGCASLDPAALHRRSVLLDRASRSIDIVDMMEGDGHTIRLAFHLGPYVQAELGESCAMLNWPTAPTPAPGAARLELPPGLRWSLHRGETDPVLGWYAPGLGLRVPAFTLLGRGRFLPGMPLITRLEFLDGGKSAKSAVSQHAVSWTTSVTSPDEALEIRMEAR
jgi:Heparinase II/III N-terminus/Heparinase II/III-like protein